MADKKRRDGLRQLAVCLVLFMAALFLRAGFGRGLIPESDVTGLRELAEKAGEALARSELVEAFAEGFRDGGLRES